MNFVRVDGTAIRRRRLELRKRIEDIAADVGISKSRLTRIELNQPRFGIRFDTLTALESVLDVKRDAFLVNDEEVT